MRSLSQFQALQEGEQELVSLRELGLTDAEIQLWLKRETPEQEEKVHDVAMDSCLIFRSNVINTIVFHLAENISIHQSAPSTVMRCRPVWFMLNRL